MIPIFWRNDSPPRLSMGGWNHRAKDVAIGYVRWPKRPAIRGARSISLDSEMHFNPCFSYLSLLRFLYLGSDRVGSKQFSLSPSGSSIFRSGFSRKLFRPFHASTETDVAEECLLLTSIDRSIFFRTAISPAFPPKAAVNFESERAETPPSRSLLLLAVLPEGLPLTVSITGYKIAVLTQWSSSAGFRAAHQKDITIEDIYTFYFLNGFSVLVYFSLFSHYSYFYQSTSDEARTIFKEHISEKINTSSVI